MLIQVINTGNMKTYKIGNKEISELSLNYDNSVNRQLFQVEDKINLLLEALSDKEEDKFLHNDDKCGDGWHTMGCEHEMTDEQIAHAKKFYPDGTPKEKIRKLEGKPLSYPNKEKRDLVFDNFLENKFANREEESRLEECKTCGCKDQDWNEPCLDIFHGEDRPKQEECNNCPHDVTPTFSDKDLVTMPKQPTSLKEEITSMILWNYQAPINTAERILKLIQSHLLKEIRPESHNHVHSIVTYCNSCKRYGGNMPDDLVCGNCGKDTDTWTYYPLQDIIKIINAL